MAGIGKWQGGYVLLCPSVKVPYGTLIPLRNAFFNGLGMTAGNKNGGHKKTCPPYLTNIDHKLEN